MRSSWHDTPLLRPSAHHPPPWRRIGARSSSSQVTVEVSLSGLKLLTPSGAHALRNVPLKDIDKWDLRGSLLTIDLKSSGSASGGEMVLTGEGRVMADLLDTIVSNCVQ